MGYKVFNSLPTDIKDISYNVKEFKRLLKKILYSKFFIRLRGIYNTVIQSILFIA
jgi:hypothetical protein